MADSRFEAEAKSADVPEAGTATALQTGGAPDLRWHQGMEVRRAVLGDAHVERAMAHTTDFDRDFQDYITRAAWGEIWTRPGLPRPTRHLLTIVMLAVLDRQEELAMHLRATQNTGVSVEEIKEVLMHVAVYAGVPAAHAAFRTAKKALFPEAAAASAGE